MSKKQLKIVVIQLTRIGDLVQTVQAVRQFKAENPETHLTLIARRKFAKGIHFLLETVFDEILTFDVKDFFAKKDLMEVRTKLHNFLFDLNQRKFDVSVNLSFSKSSSYLNSLINCQLRLGMYRHNKSEIAINDNWSQYVYSNVMNSENNPFCLVDIFRYIMGGQGVFTLDENATTKRNNQIVLHPFASHRKKRWGLNKWNELIYKLAKDHPNYSFHIVGGIEDIADANRIVHAPALKNINNRIFNHAGTFDLAQTYQLLMESALFIGHDSVVSHLAAETLTPTVMISLGTVRPHETTAYQANVVNVAPRNRCFPCQMSTSCESLPCHSSINHQAIALIAKGLLNNQSIDRNFLTENLNPFQLDTIRVFTSSFGETGLNLHEVSENYLTLPDVFKEYYKIIWQIYLRDYELKAGLPEITEETAKQLYRYQDGINYLWEIFNFGIKFSNKIIKEAEATMPNLEIIQENINKLNELDQMCSITKKSYPLLAGLIDYFYVHKANTPGNNMIEISKSNLLAYYDASNLAAVLYEFVEKSVAPYLNTSPKNMEV